MLELGLPPEGYLGESRGEVWTIHEIEVGRRFVGNAVDRYYTVVDFLNASISSFSCPIDFRLYLKLFDGCGIQAVQSDEDRQLFLSTIIS